jgi:gluconate 5-dehydrogenase
MERNLENADKSTVTVPPLHPAGWKGNGNGMSAPLAAGVEAFSLDGQVALITGAGSGIGLAIAHRMAAAGARVALVGRREAPLIDAARTIGPRAEPFVQDIADVAAAADLLSRVADRFGSVSLLVNNAGIHLKKPAIETSDEEIERLLRTHLTGAFALTRAAIPSMAAAGGGSVLFMASMASLFGIPNVVAYAMAKTGILGLVRTLAVELGSCGIRVNAIAPGWIDSPMMRQALTDDPTRGERILARTPLGRFGDADEIACAAVFLASPAGRFITGAVIPVDGGVSVGF